MCGNTNDHSQYRGGGGTQGTEDGLDGLDGSSACRVAQTLTKVYDTGGLDTRYPGILRMSLQNVSTGSVKTHRQ